MAAAGLAGSQVIGTPKNRALCERANAELENVCRCPSGDSLPRGLHRDPRPLCHGRAPLALKPGPKARGGASPDPPDLGGPPATSPCPALLLREATLLPPCSGCLPGRLSPGHLWGGPPGAPTTVSLRPQPLTASTALVPVTALSRLRGPPGWPGGVTAQPRGRLGLASGSCPQTFWAPRARSKAAP